MILPAGPQAEGDSAREGIAPAQNMRLPAQVPDVHPADAGWQPARFLLIFSERGRAHAGAIPLDNWRGQPRTGPKQCAQFCACHQTLPSTTESLHPIYLSSKTLAGQGFCGANPFHIFDRSLSGEHVARVDYLRIASGKPSRLDRTRLASSAKTMHPFAHLMRIRERQFRLKFTFRRRRQGYNRLHGG